jgi:hypothetical protein
MAVTRWMLAGALIAIAAPSALAIEFTCDGDGAKCVDSLKCTGDESACQSLQVFQEGVDHETGAHVVLRYLDPNAPGIPDSVDLVLNLSGQLSDCGAAQDLYANLTRGDSRKIDGFLCGLRATWIRR